ncbi:MAG: zinc-ribbon domain-containing protein [Tepidisphaeraceae bacterium]
MASRNTKRSARSRRGGFIILFGTKTRVSKDAGGLPGAAGTVRTRCPECHQEADIVGKRYQNWFTLFFIPVFPISGRTRFSECSNCNAQFPVPVDELGRRVSANEQQQHQQAIQLYNSLRASPANSITLNELMLMYGDMKEYDQAISAAAEFHQALHASEQCMATLGRIYLAKNDHPSALQWLDAAITRNSMIGEAHYYRALAHFTSPVPNLEQAMTSARSARNANYPQADELLREIEQKSREAHA